MSEEMVKTSIYISEDLKSRVAVLAERERRSWNSMLTILVEYHLQEIEQTATLSPSTLIRVSQ